MPYSGALTGLCRYHFSCVQPISVAAVFRRRSRCGRLCDDHDHHRIAFPPAFMALWSPWMLQINLWVPGKWQSHAFPLTLTTAEGLVLVSFLWTWPVVCLVGCCGWMISQWSRAGPSIDPVLNPWLHMMHVAEMFEFVCVREQSLSSLFYLPVSRRLLSLPYCWGD